MSLQVSIDFGTSSTCTVVSVAGGEPQVVVIDGQPLVPSAVFAAQDGTLFVGREAERQAAVDPARFEPHPKRRIDEGELLLGSRVFAVSDVIRAVLRHALTEARRYADGAAVDLLVLTHPADWGAVRTSVLGHAAAGLAKELVMVPEPVAAAVFHSAGHTLPDGSALAVLDLGGGTMDASVVRKQGQIFRVLATKGEPNFGGADIDQALLEHIGRTVSGTDSQAWTRLVEGREMADRRRRRVLRQDVRGAKETLSRHAYTDVPMPSPFSDAHVTRADLERLVGEKLARAADLVLATLRAGHVQRQQLAGVFLVGGSSRIPLVSRLIHERVGVVPTTLDQPETVVARGAMRASRLDPERGTPITWNDGTTVRNYPVGQSAGRSSARGAAPSRTPADPLAEATTIVLGANDKTRPVLPPRGNTRRRWLISGGAVAVVMVGVCAMLLFARGARPEAHETGQGRHIAQYQYTFDYPGNWQQIGGNPQLWQTMIAPQSGEADTRIAVQQGKLTYDTNADRARAVGELRDEYQRLIQHGKPLSGFDDQRSFAGRSVVYYQEQVSGAQVDWYVVHQGQFRVSVGCQYTAATQKDVENACTEVIGSLRIG